MIDKHIACLERGYWAFNALYGYKKYGGGATRKDVPNEDNVYIKELFEGFFSGRFQQLIDGARFLKEVGVLGKAHPDRYITTVGSILTQVFYAGYIEYPKWEVTRRIGIHEPTVSLELFEAVQKKIKTSPMCDRTSIQTFHFEVWWGVRYAVKNLRERGQKVRTNDTHITFVSVRGVLSRAW